jgi:hypothetical protein
MLVRSSIKCLSLQGITNATVMTVQEALIRIDGVCSERPDVLIHAIDLII